DAPKSNAAASGAVSKRPDQRLDMRLMSLGQDAQALARRLRFNRLAADDAGIALEEFEPDRAVDAFLNAVDVGVQRFAQRREPRASLYEVSVLAADGPRELHGVFRGDQLLQLGVRHVEDGGGGRFADLPRARRGDVEPADAVAAGDHADRTDDVDERHR